MIKDLQKNLLEFQRMFPDEKACIGRTSRRERRVKFACPLSGRLYGIPIATLLG